MPMNWLNTARKMPMTSARRRPGRNKSWNSCDISVSSLTEAWMSSVRRRARSVPRMCSSTAKPSSVLPT